MRKLHHDIPPSIPITKSAQAPEHVQDFAAIMMGHRRFVPFRPGMGAKMLRAREHGGEYDDKDYGLLGVHWVKPGQRWLVRLLPEFDSGKLACLRLVQHWWRGRSCCCPEHTNPFLFSRTSRIQRSEKCLACAAGVEASIAYLVYALEQPEGEAKEKPLCLAFKLTYWRDLLDLAGQGVFDFDTGCNVELQPDGSSLNARLRGMNPVSKDSYLVATEYLHVKGWWSDGKRLKAIGDAHTGWVKAGQPEPEPGRAAELQRIFPGCTLIAIPWGMKGPTLPDWQNMEHAYTLSDAYRAGLDEGNIGLLCGRDARAVADGLMPDGTVVGLDADNDEFAAEILEYNPWLKTTPCVVGERGCKWFFRVEGDGFEKCAQSTTIIRDGVHVGDWLASAKQGVISGLHPCGRMYTLTNDRVLRTVPVWQFKLPKDCKLAAQEASSYRALWRAMKGQRALEPGAILDVDKLERVQKQPDGSINARCPACASAHKDTAGDNLLIYPDGRYSCAAMIGCSPAEKHDHNSQIYQLARLEKDDDYESED